MQVVSSSNKRSATQVVNRSSKKSAVRVDGSVGIQDSQATGYVASLLEGGEEVEQADTGEGIATGRHRQGSLEVEPGDALKNFEEPLLMISAPFLYSPAVLYFLSSFLINWSFCQCSL